MKLKHLYMLGAVALMTASCNEQVDTGSEQMFDFFSQADKCLFGIVMFFVRFEERGFDITFLGV